MLSYLAGVTVVGILSVAALPAVDKRGFLKITGGIVPVPTVLGTQTVTGYSGSLVAQYLTTASDLTFAGLVNPDVGIAYTTVGGQTVPYIYAGLQEYDTEIFTAPLVTFSDGGGPTPMTVDVSIAVGPTGYVANPQQGGVSLGFAGATAYNFGVSPASLLLPNGNGGTFAAGAVPTALLEGGNALGSAGVGGEAPGSIVTATSYTAIRAGPSGSVGLPGISGSAILTGSYVASRTNTAIGECLGIGANGVGTTLCIGGPTPTPRRRSA